MTVGEKIQTYRKQLGMSQEELGQKLLVSRQTISLWEKDQTVPTIDNLIRLREIFGVSVDEILGFETIEQNNEILPNELYRFTFSKEELSEIKQELIDLGCIDEDNNINLKYNKRISNLLIKNYEKLNL